jgi:uncharacterized protein YqjF (DUF2071 family)
MPQPMIAAQPRCAPTGPWLWSQHWLDLFFAHWPVAVSVLRPHVPAALEIDTRDGAAWVSLVAFRLERIRQRFLPSLGFLTNSVELNVRTYVRYHGEPAICFLSIHAGNPLLIRLARWATPLPYSFARMSYRWDKDTAQFASHCPAADGGATLAATFSPTAAGSTAQAGSLDEWLLERYFLYVQGRDGTLFRTVVQHAPWEVRPAKARITSNTMGQAFGLDLSREPEKVHFSPGVHAHIWPFAERPRLS